MVNTLNLGLRFVLEMVALVALAMWGASLSDGVMGMVCAIIVPLVGAFVWGTFRVAGDPSNNGKAPVQIPGSLRLALELGVFALASLALISTNHTIWAVSLICVVMVHYAISYKRNLWLIHQ